MIRWLGTIGILGLSAFAADGLPPGLKIIEGPVNGVEVQGRVLVYGDPSGKIGKRDAVLLTTARRDAAWAAAKTTAAGTPLVAPAAERRFLDDPADFWGNFEATRFHDYQQGTSKQARERMPISRAASPGEKLEYGGVTFEVVNGRGYSTGAVAYLASIGGKRVAFTGDMIYGNGQLLDLYSLQDSIPESKTRGYHGYAARAGDLIENLRAIAQQKPDVLIPLRGPVIHNPQEAIATLVARLQELMASHFSTDALLWYWGPESLRLRSTKALDQKPVDSMPMGLQRKLPEWVIPIGNSRLVLSPSGGAILVDGGYSKIFEELDKLKLAGRFKQLEGIWITHYHDDHTDYVEKLRLQHRVPVWATPQMSGILQHPEKYRMPCSTENGIAELTGRGDGEKWQWREFELQALYFPGQTLYHQGLLLKRTGAESILFVGDSFTPSGLDDYCLLNRDFVERGQGYQFCLDKIEDLSRGNPELWLINQHVEPMFRFDAAQMARMRKELDRRAAILAKLSPFPAANFAVDEGWARMYPYGSRLARGGTIDLELVILNHAREAREFSIGWNAPPGLEILKGDRTIRIAAGAEGRASVRLRGRKPGLAVVTADVGIGDIRLREWTEAMIRVD